MDRFRWCSDEVEHRGFSGSGGLDEESTVVQLQPGVFLYDGTQQTGFKNGFLRLTTHRILWSSSGDFSITFLALPLAAVVSCRREEGSGHGARLLGGGRTPKLCLQLLSVTGLVNVLNGLSHPLKWHSRWCPLALGRTAAAEAAMTSAYAAVARSTENSVRLGFTRGGMQEFCRALEETLAAKPWTVADGTSKNPSRYVGAGIGAIQRQQAANLGVTDQRLEESFSDLNKLMTHAGEMVNLCRSLAKQALESKSDQLTSDETSQLRAAMMSVGIDQDGAGDSPAKSDFHSQLSRQLADLFTPILRERSSGGLATAVHPHAGTGCLDLASVYCWFNRARGMQLISPEDLLKSCKLLAALELPIRLKQFPSGLKIIHLASENETETLTATADLVRQRQSLTSEELSRAIGLPLLLARERLLAVELDGLVCRDESEAGLRFYPNRFLETH